MNKNPNSPSRVRIVFCHYSSDVGGGSDRCLFDLVTHLSSERFQSTLVLKTGDPMADLYRSAGLEVVEMDFFRPQRALVFRKLFRFFMCYWTSVFKLVRILRKIDPDIVHVNTLHNLQAPVAVAIAGRPLVWHVRELGNGRIDRILRALARLLATRVVAMSTAVAESLASCGDRVRIVFDGIDLREYENLEGSAEIRSEWGVGPDEALVTTVGRLEPWKGQAVLVEAIPAILEKHPNAHIAIVGAAAVNKPEYEVALKSRCRELQIFENVVFTGIRGDVPQILAASDVLVLPTKTAEPYGRTVIEAMAAGCPVVATARGGPLDTVSEGQTGLLVPPDDAEAMADKINMLLSDRDAARRMGEQGRRRARAHFSLERSVLEMAVLFEEVMQER